MEKLKKFYKEHRIFVILMGIVAICFILMLIMLLRYFYFGTTKSSHTRTCPEIKEDKQKEFSTKLNEDPAVKDSAFRLSDKSNIIYLTIDFNIEATLVDAQSKAIASLENLSEEERTCYDIQFILIQDASDSSEGFHIMGASNAAGTSIKWNNNNVQTETAE